MNFNHVIIRYEFYVRVCSVQREELDRNVQLQVLIASVLQSVLRDGEKN